LDLEKYLTRVVSTPGKLTRRWLIIEGLYCNFGDFAPLPKIIELKTKYKFRLIMDDSYGVGNVGKTGRGTCEHFGVDIKQVEFLTGSLESTVGSVGGFACSGIPNTYHSRINSSGYTYSASLPPLLNNAALASFQYIEKHPNILQELHGKAKLMFDELSSCQNMYMPHGLNGPFFHLRLQNPPSSRIEEEEILQEVCDEALRNGVFISRAKYSDELLMPPASIRICVCRALSDEEIIRAAKVIKAAAAEKASSRFKVVTTNEKEKSSVATPRRIPTRLQQADSQKK